ncbi:DUF736 family protein [Rhizobium leguminosarum bv. viciae]|nr:DUF736 family protein [Rhizobium leguminosarum bv. viciae]
MSKAMRQMPEVSGRSERQAGEARPSSGLEEAAPPARIGNDTGAGLLEVALRRENLLKAWKQVRANKGAAGADGLDIDQTAAMLCTAWPVIRDSLQEGTYRPQPVRRVMIPKPGGGEREFGIPTALDRLIQQALLQVLQPILDPIFSQHSYGFRPGKSALDAVLAAQSFVQSGRRVVVDVDLEKFFDRVVHDILIDRLRRKIPDPGVIRLVRAYLNADIVDGDTVIKRTRGTPQGGPLSPLLANVLLDEVDKELESAAGLRPALHREIKKAVVGRPPFHFAPRGAPPIVPCPTTVIEIAMGAIRSAKGHSIMATIGTFTRSETGEISGSVKTLTLNVKSVKLVPAEGDTETGPDYRVLSSAVEFGAAWKKQSDKGNAYLSVKLDDPSFANPHFSQRLWRWLTLGCWRRWGLGSPPKMRAVVAAMWGVLSGPVMYPFSLVGGFRSGGIIGPQRIFGREPEQTPRHRGRPKPSPP